nr:limb region 1 protein homolog [Pseudochaenichthys georgianus]
MEEDDVSIREQNFHSQVREYIICFLLFAVLYIVSYCIITRYKRKSDDHEDEDAVVNRISLYLCTFTLAVSGGAVFLLPFSIISNEILLSFPKNYYIQWLNGSLIHGQSDRGIGNTSLSTFGLAQAVLEIILMFYLMVSSVVGFYSLRVFQSLTPRNDDTTMTTIIGCCVSILVLSSALPVMSRTLGITRFDLLGDFGRFNWLGNFYIVLSYNMLFAVVTTLCLVRKFTSAVREELLKALGLDKLQLSNSPTDPESGKLSANGHQKTL